MDKAVFEFIIYMIHACSDKWGLSPSNVYKRLQKSDCIERFLIPHYEVLHTQSTKYIVEDIEKYLEVRENAA